MDAQGIWEAADPAAGVTVDEKKNKAARAFIFQAIPEDVLLQVAQKKNAKDIWEALKTRYLGVDRVKKARLQTLRSEFQALRMKEEESIDAFTGKLSGMASLYLNLGATIDDAALVKKLLDSVPDKFFPVMAGIVQFFDIDTMPFEEAIGKFKANKERDRLRGGGINQDGQLLVTHTEWQAR